jgi:hypothetical protein
VTCGRCGHRATERRDRRRSDGEAYVRRDTSGFEEAYRRLGPKTIEGLILRFEDIVDAETTGLDRPKLDELASRLG